MSLLTLTALGTRLAVMEQHPTLRPTTGSADEKAANAQKAVTTDSFCNGGKTKGLDIDGSI